MLRLKKFWSLIFLGIVFVILQASPLLASVPLSTFDAGLSEHLSMFDLPKFLGYDQRGNPIEEPPDGILDNGEIANITGISINGGGGSYMKKISSLNGVSKLVCFDISVLQ